MSNENGSFEKQVGLTQDQAIQKVSFEVMRSKSIFEHDGKQHDTERDVLFRVQEGKPLSLGYVGRDYKFIPHADALMVAFEALQKSGLPFTLHSLQLDRNGAKMYASFKTGVGFEITPGNQGDTLSPILTLVNSYDGGNRLGFDLESERLVCLNLARAMSKDLQLRFMHTLSASVEALKKAAIDGIEGFEKKIVPFYRQLAQVEVDKETAVKAVAVAVAQDAVPKNVASFAKHCVDSDTASKEGIKRTMWAVFNAFTWASTTRGKDLSPTRDREIRGKIAGLFADGGQKLLADAKAMDQAKVLDLFKVAA